MSKGQWHTFPAVEIEGKLIAITGKWLKKAVIAGEARQEYPLADPGAAVEILKSQRRSRRADIFTFAQQLPSIDVQYSYPMEWDSVAAIPLTDFASWWSALPQTVRKNVRRAEKRGVTIEIREFSDDLVRAIAATNDASPLRQGRSNYHYGKTFEAVKRETQSYVDRSTFICAFVAGEMVAFLKLVYQRQSAFILNLAVKPEHHDKKPANAMIAKAVELCVAREIKYLRYGFYNYGNKQDSSLREFKITNGFVEVLVPRYNIPLTLSGRLCMRLNLHKGALAILPPRLIALLLELRTRWYNKKTAARRTSAPQDVKSERP